jgi:hypothetical protein
MNAPIASSSVPISGAEASAERCDSSSAPSSAPAAPGTPSRSTRAQSTLPKRQCAYPDASAVPIFARCTDALAAAGLSPASRSSVVDVTP